METDLAARTMQEMLKRDAAIDQLACVLTGREIEVGPSGVGGPQQCRNRETPPHLRGHCQTPPASHLRETHVAGRVDLTVYAREIGLV